MIFSLAEVLPVDVKSYIPDGPTALLITILLFAIIAIVKGWVVPKPFYDREVKRGDDATDALRKNNEVLEALTSEVRIRREAGHE